MKILQHHKITHDNYILHEVEALEGMNEMINGANNPLQIRGVIKATGDKADFIVKFNAGERMSPTARCFEYLAACMAKELDLCPAEPVIIEITQEFVDQSVGMTWWGKANKSIGINYGCYYTTGGRNFADGEVLTPKQYEEAQKIFAFDLFTINTDRNKIKQNMVTDGENILIFDHELAFGFVFELFSSNDATPWSLKETDKDWIAKHYFYPYLKGNVVEFEEFVNKFTNLGAGFWEKIDQNLPLEWKVDHLEKIKNRTMTFIEKKELFIEQLKLILE